MLNPERIAERLAFFRKGQGLSQTALAEAVGVRPQAVSKWECAQAVPELDTLLALARLYGVTVDALIAEDTDAQSFVSTGALPPGVDASRCGADAARTLRRLARLLSPSECALLASMWREPGAALTLTARAAFGGRTAERTIAAERLSDAALEALAPLLAEALAPTLDRVDAGLRAVLPRMRCPRCGAALTLCADGADTGVRCAGGHAFPITDGVLDFGTREIKGELWSQWLKNYDQFVRLNQEININQNYLRGERPNAAMLAALAERKPSVIVDVASGMASGVAAWIDRVTWPCVVVLTDVSHRILKYDRVWFEKRGVPAHVRMAYVACDCAKMPFDAGCVDAVTSFAGFESMQAKCLDGFAEAYRALRTGGAAVYTLATVAGDENTAQWRAAMRRSPDPDLRAWEETLLYTRDDWRCVCARTGYNETTFREMFGELPAPADGVFPYENEILQWMAEQVCVSVK